MRLFDPGLQKASSPYLPARCPPTFDRAQDYRKGGLYSPSPLPHLEEGCRKLFLEYFRLFCNPSKIRLAMPIKRTQGSVLVDVRHPKPIDLSDFLKRIFYMSPTSVMAVERLIHLIAQGKVRRDNWREAAKMAGIPTRTYHYYLRRLRSVGLIDQVEGQYMLSRRFVRAMRELADYWETFAERAKERGS